MYKMNVQQQTTTIGDWQLWWPYDSYVLYHSDSYVLWHDSYDRLVNCIDDSYVFWHDSYDRLVILVVLFFAAQQKNLFLNIFYFNIPTL